MCLGTWGRTPRRKASPAPIPDSPPHTASDPLLLTPSLVQSVFEVNYGFPYFADQSC